MADVLDGGVRRVGQLRRRLRFLVDGSEDRPGRLRRERSDEVVRAVVVDPTDPNALVVAGVRVGGAVWGGWLDVTELRVGVDRG
ncbi:hypothetical protein ACFQFH_08980 [Halobaculum halobium]|uniref:hypothetical protein n=1 Tax=Halobaculum halobium TaxID=3032281 RepID=UPI003621C1BE